MSDEKKPAEKKPAKAKPIDGLFIRSKSKYGFRRCGFQFCADGVGIALSALTPEQIETLKAEPALIVEESTFADETVEK